MTEKTLGQLSTKQQTCTVLAIAKGIVRLSRRKPDIASELTKIIHSLHTETLAYEDRKAMMNDFMFLDDVFDWYSSGEFYKSFPLNESSFLFRDALYSIATDIYSNYDNASKEG